MDVRNESPKVAESAPYSAPQRVKDARSLAYVEDQRDILTDAIARANNLFNEAMTQQIEYLRRVYFRSLEVDKEKLRLLSEKANEAYIARKMAEAGLGEHLDSFST